MTCACTLQIRQEVHAELGKSLIFCDHFELLEWTLKQSASFFLMFLNPVLHIFSLSVVKHWEIFLYSGSIKETEWSYSSFFHIVFLIYVKPSLWWSSVLQDFYVEPWFFHDLVFSFSWIPFSSAVSNFVSPDIKFNIWSWWQINDSVDGNTMFLGVPLICICLQVVRFFFNLIKMSLALIPICH